MRDEPIAFAVVLAIGSLLVFGGLARPCTGAITQHMGMFSAKKGYWFVSSKSDPRWNGGGEVPALIVTAGMPTEAREYIRRKAAELGSDPPDDLECWSHKD